MVPYLMLILAPIFLSLVTPRRIFAIVFFLTFLGYLAFVGWRDEVGPDWGSYLYNLEVVATQRYSEIAVKVEPLFYAALKLSGELDLGILGINVFSAFLFLAGVFAFSARSPLPWVALAAATIYLVPALGMSAIRQSCALGIIFVAFAYWPRLSVVQKSLFIGIASLFHISAILLLVLLLLGGRGSIQLRIVKFAIGAAMVVGYLLYGQGDRLELYGDRYGAGSTLGIVAPGAAFHLTINAVPALIYLVMRKRFEAAFGPNPLMYYLSLASLLLFLALPISSVGASRLSMYLTIVPMFVSSGLVRLFGGSRRTIIAVAVFIACLFVNVIWLSFGNNREGYVPYRNYLFPSEGSIQYD
jgi:hypothetical protein